MTQADPIGLQENEPSTLSRWVPGLVIIGLTLAAYLPIVRAGFIWDDDHHVFANPLLLNLHGLKTMWTVRDALPQYYPLTHTFFWVEHHLWQNAPLGYHIDNVLIHTINAVLVWRLLKHLGISAAWLAAMLFALHPVNVETAAWVTERKNTLSGLFYLLSLNCYFKLFERWTWPRYTAALLLFIAALLSKTVTSTLPAVILLIIWWKHGRIVWRDVWPLIPFFVLGIIAGANTAALERTHVGASGPAFHFASSLPAEAVARCLIAGRAIWFYLLKLIVPYPLEFEYPRWHISVDVAWQYLFPLAAIALLLSLILLARRIGRGPATAILFFVGTLVPALGFNNIYPMLFSFVADHFQYLASIGPLTLIAVTLHRAAEQKKGFYIPTELVIGGLGLLTFLRVTAFQSEIILYNDSLAKNPNGWMSHSNLGALYSNQNDLESAEFHLNEAVRLNPRNAIGIARLGELDEKRGLDDAAIDKYEAALRINPAIASVHASLGKLYLRKQQVAQADASFKTAISLEPSNAQYHNLYGVMLASLGRYADAVVQFDDVVRLDPSSEVGRRDRLAALERSAQWDRAADEIHQMVAQHPDAVLYSDLGIVETMRHNRQAAIDAYSHSMQLNPAQLGVQQRLKDLQSAR